MRVYLLLASASLLASCGGAGGGVSSLSSSAATPTGAVTPTPAATPTPSATPTPTSTPTPGATPTPSATPAPTATPIPTATPTPTSSPTPTPAVTGSSSAVIPQAAAPTGKSMFDVTSAVAFKAVGGIHALDATTAQVDAGTIPASMRRVVTSTLYAGNASTPTGLGSINYDPRDAIFEVSFADAKAGVTQTHRYQDPGHRTDFTGGTGVITLQNWNYLSSGSATDQSVFFYQRPGNKANYVTLAGYYFRSDAGGTAAVREIRGAVAFGAPTPTTQIPRTGGGNYSGEFLATMVASNFADPKAGPDSYQWIQGNSAVHVDFGKATVGVQLEGNVTDGRTILGQTINNDQLLVRGGSSFSAKAETKLDLASGTFAGKFDTATFGSMNGAPLDFAAITPGSSVAGASSVDGLFYGPVADEVGGSFRIIGGRPDPRVDVLGAFTAKKLPQ